MDPTEVREGYHISPYFITEDPFQSYSPHSLMSVEEPEEGSDVAVAEGSPVAGEGDAVFAQEYEFSKSSVSHELAYEGQSQDYNGG